MSDLQLLFLVLGFLYLWDCLLWVPRGTVVFRTWGGRHWRTRFPSPLAGNAAGGFVLAPPLPPLGDCLPSRPVPLSIAPEGLLAFVASNLDPNVRAPQTGRSLSWDQVRHLECRGRSLRLNGATFVRLGTTVAAQELCRALRDLAGLAPAAREPALRRWLSERFDPEAIRRRWAECRRVARPLRWLGNAYFGLLLVLTPALTLTVGLGRVWPALVIGALALGSGISLQFRRAHRALHPGAEEERFTQSLIVLLSPPSAIRARDLLTRPVFELFHPLAVATVLCGPGEVEALARRVLTECRHPARPLGPPESAGIEAWARQLQGQLAEALVARSGRDPETLLTPPAPQDPACRTWCPRCRSQFTRETGDCPDCPGIPLQPLHSRPA